MPEECPIHPTRDGDGLGGSLQGVSLCCALNLPLLFNQKETPVCGAAVIRLKKYLRWYRPGLRYQGLQRKAMSKEDENTIYHLNRGTFEDKKGAINNYPETAGFT